MKDDGFEIYTEDGTKFRYIGDEYSWQYDLQEGSLGLLDFSRIEILKDDEVVLRINKVLAVGDVGIYTTLVQPFKYKIRVKGEKCL